MEKLTSCYPTGLKSQITPNSGRWVPGTAYDGPFTRYIAGARPERVFGATVQALESLGFTNCDRFFPDDTSGPSFACDYPCGRITSLEDGVVVAERYFPPANGFSAYRVGVKATFILSDDGTLLQINAVEFAMDADSPSIEDIRNSVEMDHEEILNLIVKQITEVETPSGD